MAYDRRNGSDSGAGSGGTGSGGKSPGKRTLTQGLSPSAAAGDGGPLFGPTFGLGETPPAPALAPEDDPFGLHLGALHGRKTAKTTGPETKPKDSGTLPVATMVVEVYDGRGRLIAKRSVPAHDPLGEGGYEAKREGGGWQWAEDGGKDARVDVEINEQGEVTNPGQTVESWVRTLPRGGSASRIVIRVLSEQSAGKGGGAGAGNAGDGAVKEPTKKGPVSVDDLPDALTNGDQDRDGQQDGQADGQDGGTGTSSPTTTRRGPARTGVEKGKDGGSETSRGNSTTTDVEGDNQGRREGEELDDEGAIGRLSGPKGGRAGATIHDKEGRARGKKTGEGTDSSLVHNPLAEQAPGQDGNIPPDGGKKGGMQGGQAGSKGGGLPDAIGFWQLITVPGDIAPFVAAGMILADADVTSVGETLVKKALAGAARKALAKTAREEIANLVELEMRKIEKGLMDSAEWVDLDDAARQAKLSITRREVAAQTRREVVENLDKRIAELQGDALSLNAIGDGDGIGGDMVREAREYVDIELDATRKARGALDELDPRVGKDAPYSARSVRDELIDDHGAAVTPHSVPPQGGPKAKNAHLAGKRHPKTGIAYDDRGFPIFDDIAAFDTRIPGAAVSVKDRAVHMRAATEQLDDAIKRGEVSSMRFSQEQMVAIRAHEDIIPGYTWHHHQETGRMQLIPRQIHKDTGHAGGFTTWFE